MLNSPSLNGPLSEHEQRSARASNSLDPLLVLLQAEESGRCSAEYPGRSSERLYGRDQPACARREHEAEGERSGRCDDIAVALHDHKHNAPEHQNRSSPTHLDLPYPLSDIILRNIKLQSLIPLHIGQRRARVVPEPDLPRRRNDNNARFARAPALRMERDK